MDVWNQATDLTAVKEGNIAFNHVLNSNKSPCTLLGSNYFLLDDVDSDSK